MQSLPDIAGSNSTAPLATPNITARTVILAVVGNGTVRIGGPNTSASNGAALISGTPLVLPVLSQDGHSTSPYGLGGTYAYVPTGTTLTVAYEPFD